jgi:uncharacterized protein (TIGR02145 family)
MRSSTRSFFLLIIFALAISCNEDSPIPSVEHVMIGGKEYAIVKIGNQTWTASNYAGPGGVNYDGTNSKPEYGKYYSKTELDAIEIPAGWRIPTVEDYTALAQTYGIPIPSTTGYGEAIKALTSTTNWKHVQGTNTSGFNAFPAGYVFGASGPLDGDIAEFWAAGGITFSIQEAGLNLSSLRLTFYDSSNSPDYRFNVRFVKE